MKVMPDDSEPVLRLPARDIPVSASLTPPAQATVAMGPFGTPSYPPRVTWVGPALIRPNLITQQIGGPPAL